MNNRDKRYNLIKPMIAEGKITTFNDIFFYIPKTTVAIDLGKKVDRFSELMKRTQEFTLEELFIIGGFCGLNEREIVELAIAEYFKNKDRLRMSKKLS